MLERASACLESSIWCSRNAQKRVASSKRLLHSTFWNHGASYLDHFPYNFDYRRDGTSSVTNDVADTTTAVRPDSPFLDFLYPTQALALLSRSCNPPADRPRRRTVVGSRQYSSLPRARHAHDIRVAQLRTYSNQSPLDVLAPEEEQDEEEMAVDNLRAGIPEARATGAPTEVAIKGKARRRVQCKNKTQNGEAAVVIDDTGVYRSTNMQSLWDIVSKSHQPQTPLPRVRTLWNLLDETQKSDANLKRALHCWLASRRQYGTRKEAWEWSRQILSEIRVEERTLQVYRSAIEVALLFNDESAARGMIRQAMDRRMIGNFGCGLLFEHHLKRQRWAQASRFLSQIHTYSSWVKDSSVYHQIFVGVEGSGWHRTWLPKLMKFLESSSEDSAELQQLKTMFGRIAARFPVWISQSSDPKILKTRVAFFRDFLAHIQGKSYASNAYEPMIFELIKTMDGPRKAIFSGLVGLVWHDYDKVIAVKPSKLVLSTLLSAWEDGLLLNPTQPPQDGYALRPQRTRKAWEQHYGRLDYVSRLKLAIISARAGDVPEVESLVMDYVNEEKSAFDPDFFWTFVYVHARRRDAAAAQAAFDKISVDFDIVPNARTWDILLHVYDRADDLNGALACFRRRIDAGVSLNPRSISPLLNLYAKLGNADAIVELLDFARAVSVPIDTHMMNSLIVAHSNAGDFEKAVATLEDTIAQMKSKQITGSLRICFNSVLSLHAQRKDFGATISLYRQMKQQQIPFDERSYASMVLALCQRRRPDSAWRIVDKIMPVDGFQPTVFHYTAIIAGFVTTKEYDYAIDVYHKMERAGIKPTVSTRAAYLKAKALQEHTRPTYTEEMPFEQAEGKNLDGPRPLDDTIQELLTALEQDTEFASGSEFGTRNVPLDQAKASLFETLIWIHGKRRCFDAAWQLFHASTKDLSGAGDQMPPFRLVTAMMSVYYQAGDHDEVERCWDMLVQEAERLRLVRLPQLPQSTNTNDLIDSIRSLSTDPRTCTAPAPSKRFLLSVPFRYLILSLSTNPSLPPSRLTSLLSTLLSLLQQSYVFDNKTWNTLIQTLCSLSPPRVLLAYTLTERFLIPHFPGWLYPNAIVANEAGVPNKSRRAEGLEYIDYNQRFIPAGERVPLYRTMVWLAHGLLELRKLETLGGAELERGSEAALQVGSVREVSKRAPRTVEQVRNLPIVYDGLQRRLIRGGMGDQGQWFGQRG